MYYVYCMQLIHSASASCDLNNAGAWRDLLLWAHRTLRKTRIYCMKINALSLSLSLSLSPYLTHTHSHSLSLTLSLSLSSSFRTFEIVTTTNALCDLTTLGLGH